MIGSRCRLCGTRRRSAGRRNATHGSRTAPSGSSTSTVSLPRLEVQLAEPAALAIAGVAGVGSETKGPPGIRGPVRRAVTFAVGVGREVAEVGVPVLGNDAPHGENDFLQPAELRGGAVGRRFGSSCPVCDAQTEQQEGSDRSTHRIPPVCESLLEDAAGQSPRLRRRASAGAALGNRDPNYNRTDSPIEHPSRTGRPSHCD